MKNLLHLLRVNCTVGLGAKSTRRREANEEREKEIAQREREKEERGRASSVGRFGSRSLAVHIPHCALIASGCIRCVSVSVCACG